MRLLVGLHHLELGGSQLNALDLALTMREFGHDVALFGVHAGRPGPVADMARAAGLPITLARHPLERIRRGLPMRPRIARGLTAAARVHRADLVHAYEFPLFLDAFHGPHLRLGIPVAATVYAMAVPRWLPRYPQLVLGTQQLVDEADTFRAPATLIEPPVNTTVDDPAIVDGRRFRAEHGIEDGEVMAVVVSRLEPDMKAEGIDRAMDALGMLDHPRLRLVVVGGGPSYRDLRDHASAVNAALGRRAVVLTGPLADPRPAYAAADLALGMGGSALRAMAFGTALVVLGIQGFSRPLTPETFGHFKRAGFYGIGDGDLDPAPLAGQLRALVDDGPRRVELGRWSRRIVEERYSLKYAADKLSEVYERSLAARHAPAARLGESIRSGAHKTVADLLPTGLRRRLRPGGAPRPASAPRA
jgi:glycosyltransferase involved in cell wall biosynthesis